MRALTLWQPWAWAVAAGKKTVENRPWAPPKSAIGETIAIHAGKVYDEDGEAFLRKHGVAIVPGMGIHGAILGTVRIDGFVELGQLHPDPVLLDPMFFGRFGWKLSQARLFLEPVECKGALGLWRIPTPAEMLMPAPLNAEPT